jgi:nicotinamide-nucleotide amidase
MDDELRQLGNEVGALLVERGATISIAEGSCGGLVSAALLSVPGASAYFVGGSVIYTGSALRGLLGDAVEAPAGLRGASEPFALHLARSVRTRLDTTWGIGEGGAAGPTGNRYGDPAGHAWVAVAGPVERTAHVLTGRSDRPSNMERFATAALRLAREVITG